MVVSSFLCTGLLFDVTYTHDENMIIGACSPHYGQCIYGLFVQRELRIAHFSSRLSIFSLPHTIDR